MKKLLFFSIFVLLSSPSQAASSDNFTTGHDWLQRMSPREKYISLVAPMSVMHRYGVPMHLSPEGYIPVIDKIMRVNPQLANEDVANVFASALYRLEPDSRPSLDAMEREFLKGSYDPQEIRLTLHQDLT